MKPRISMITLGVRDLSASVKFYEQGLGFPRLDSPPEVAFFSLNGTWLGLYGREALANDANVSADGQGFESFTLAHNVHSEEEVDEVMNQAIEAGATCSITDPIRLGATIRASDLLLGRDDFGMRYIKYFRSVEALREEESGPTTR